MRKRTTEAAKLPQLTFGQMQTFLTLARRGKQAAAEAALGKSQSQISRDLSAIERALGGVPLFDRSARTPTEAGQAVLEYATKSFRDWQGLCDRLGNERDGCGEVILATDADCLGGAVLPFLAELRQRRPNLRVRVRVRANDSCHITNMVADGEAEVGILRMGNLPKSVSIKPWLKAKIMAAVPATLGTAQRKTISWKMLCSLPVWVDREGSPVCDAIPAQLRNRKKNCINLQEAGAERHALLSAVADGLGAALLQMFRGARDPLARDLPQGVVLRSLEGRPEICYGIAVRREWQAGGAALTLINSLMRAARR